MTVYEVWQEGRKVATFVLSSDAIHYAREYGLRVFKVDTTEIVIPDMEAQNG